MPLHRGAQSRGIGDVERTLKDTLITTQKLAEEMKEAARRKPDEVVVVCFSGRGDKDCFEVAQLQGQQI